MEGKKGGPPRETGKRGGPDMIKASGTGVRDVATDQLVVGSVIPAPDHKNPPSRDNRTLQERAGIDPWMGKPEEDQDEVALEGEDHKFMSREGKNLDELAEQIGGLKCSTDVPIDRQEELGAGADGGGKRLNKGKTKMELTPPEWEWALADVTTQGSKKYDERNWEQGMKWSIMIGCMKRHINKFLANERYDGPEFNLEKGTTGCHHLAMVAWNALALMSYDLRKIGENDLPSEVQLELFDRVNGATSDMGEMINDEQE